MHDAVSNHRRMDWLFNRLFMRRSKKTSKLRVTRSLAFKRGIHRWPVNSPHKGSVKWKMFPFDDVIMGSGCGWDEPFIPDSCLVFNGGTVEDRTWMINYTTQFYTDVITYPYFQSPYLSRSPHWQFARWQHFAADICICKFRWMLCLSI